MKNRGSRGRLVMAATAAALAAVGVGRLWAEQFRDVPAGYWARAAIERAAGLGLLAGRDGRFEPERPVTRAELAVVLVRLVDAIEKSGPKAISRSPARHDVPPAQRAALRRLPAKHWSTPALKRLVEGGYLSPPASGRAWLPTAEGLDRPAPAAEVATAVSSVVARIEEKKVALEHPEALKEGERPETR